MKRRAFLEKALKKFGFTDDQIKDFIEKLDDDYSDDDAAKALASLLTADEAKGNDEIFKDVKKRTKAEALDPIDKLLKGYESKLTPEQKVEYAKFGENESHKKYQFMLKTFDEAGSKTGDKNYDDLKGDYDKLKGQLTTDYVAKADHETVVGKLSARDREIIDVKLINAAIRSGKLKDTSSERHFERNFAADAQDLLNTGLGEKKIKGVYNPETGQVMRVDSPDQPVLIDNKAVTLNDLAVMTITGYGYEKRSDTPPVNPVPVPVPPGQGGKVKNAALSEMMKEEAANR